MLNNILKVFDEDLINSDLSAATLNSDKVVAAGSTMGALCVNVFAEGAATLTSNVSITVKHGDTENGTFSNLLTITAEAGNYADGALLATATLPQDTKAYVMAAATSSTANKGHVRVTLGYLAR